MKRRTTWTAWGLALSLNVIGGAHASESRKTGFAGVLDAGRTSSAAEFVAILRGGDNADHDFSSVLNDTALEDLASFINEGLIDDRAHLNYSSKKLVGASLSEGRDLYDGTCAACHRRQRSDTPL